MVSIVDRTEVFEAERPRLPRIAARVLADHAEAEDVVLVDAVGVALGLVLDRLSPQERVAFVMHDSFGIEFSTIATVLDITPVAARKLASRARSKVLRPAPRSRPADWEVVDAFVAAAREGDFEHLLRLLDPDVAVTADGAAMLTGTPGRISGRDEVARFFNGSAHAALPVFVGSRPAAAWSQRGRARALFDFTVVDGLVSTSGSAPSRRCWRGWCDAMGSNGAADPAGGHTSRAPIVRQSNADTPNKITGREPHMSTVTCRQLGGPCDLEHRGETADDVINAQDRHLKEAEKAGDAAHQGHARRCRVAGGTPSNRWAGTAR